MLWRERHRVAAAIVLAATALLGLLDFATRGATDPSGTPMVWLSLGLLMASGAAATARWENQHQLWRLLPAVAALGAVLGSILWADAAATSNAATGMTTAAFIILVYVGFVQSPGTAFFFSPLIVIVALLAHLREEFRISLALPLLVVPIAALMGELISALTERSVKTTDRFHSREARLTCLEDVLRRFSRPNSLAEAAYEVALAAQEIFGVERSTVILRDSKGDLIPAAIGPPSDEVPDEETSRLVAEAIGGEEPRMLRTSNDTDILVLPLPTADIPAGAVVVHPISPEDTEFTIDLARLFGTQVGIAIEHLFMIDQLERATTTDQLTGMGNRKHADALLESLEEGDAIIVLDLDGFKAVNDTHGHAAGDQVLQDLSGHLRHCLRDSDTSARLGGDEFLIVARRAFADPLAVADRILLGWARNGRSTTLSAGVALHHRDTNPRETYNRADKALYEAKADGKNRAHMWHASLIDLSTNGSADVSIDLSRHNGDGPIVNVGDEVDLASDAELEVDMD